MQIAFMVVQLPHLQPYLSDYSVDVLMVVMFTYVFWYMPENKVGLLAANSC